MTTSNSKRVSTWWVTTRWAGTSSTLYEATPTSLRAHKPTSPRTPTRMALRLPLRLTRSVAPHRKQPLQGFPIGLLAPGLSTEIVRSEAPSEVRFKRLKSHKSPSPTTLMRLAPTTSASPEAWPPQPGLYGLVLVSTVWSPQPGPHCGADRSSPPGALRNCGALHGAARLQGYGPCGASWRASGLLDSTELRSPLHGCQGSLSATWSTAQSTAYVRPVFETRSTFQILLQKWDRVMGRTTPRFLTHTTPGSLFFILLN